MGEALPKLGVKHLIRCVCVLPQLSKQTKPPEHEFVVFSTYDDSIDDFGVSFVQCDNCGVIHKVTDICMSTIIRGRDEMKSIITIEDVKSSISPKIVEILEQHRVDLPTWQQAAWVIEDQLWGTPIVLSSEYIDGTRQGKIMTIFSENLYKIGNFTNETVAK